jgi:lipopolysaccharide O-acetyltransferase
MSIPVSSPAARQHSAPMQPSPSTLTSSPSAGHSLPGGVPGGVPSGVPSGQELIEVRVKRGSFLRRVYTRLSEWCRTVAVRRQLREIGDGTRLVPPILVYGAASIRIGKGVCIWQHARLIAHNADEGGVKIDIGDGASIHPYAHISAIRSVRIGAGALFASNVYISDHDHDWRDPDDPPISNARVLAAPVDIGPNVWLGERVCVLRGVTIGEGSIVGAGSVVTKDIPPRSIAVGAPARVIRRWDATSRRWVAAE